MNYWWRMLVQVAQAKGHITQYLVADFLWQDTIPLQAGGQGGVEVFHHQHRQWGALVEAHTEELYNTWVVQSTEELTFLSKTLQRVCLFLRHSQIYQNIVDLLAYTF